eukprot:1479302-Amphidinium_carterae.1
MVVRTVAIIMLLFICLCPLHTVGALLGRRAAAEKAGKALCCAWRGSILVSHVSQTEDATEYERGIILYLAFL